MGQSTSGLHAILSHPAIYSAFQSLMGSHQARLEFVSDYVHPKQNDSILDIGCGPAEILDYLPDVVYYGFDISQAYISKAKEKYGDKGQFICKNLKPVDIENLLPFDIVMAISVLHHLDDMDAANLLNLAYHSLKPGGRLVTVDPCLVPGQNLIARFLINHDRGQNVRTREGYKSLVSPIFAAHRLEIKHRAWIPYTHCFMECTRS